MPIAAADFKPVSPGLKWDRRARQALFDVRDPQGKRVRRVIDYDSVEAAKAAFPAFRADVKAGKYADTDDAAAQRSTVTTSAPTFAEYVTQHWDSLHGKCSEKTRKTNKNVLKNHVNPFFGEMKMNEIGEAECEDFAAHMKNTKKLAPPTINGALRFVRKVLHHARRRKVIAEVPEHFHFAKETMLQLELTDAEQVAFIAAFDDEKGFRAYLKGKKRTGKVVKSPHFGFKERVFGGGMDPDGSAAEIYFERFRRSQHIFIAALDLGYRETDLRLLKRSSVNLKTGLVTILTQKTGKAAIVALSDRCRDAIETALAQQVVSTEYVFTTDAALPYSESTLRRHFAVAKELAGITRRCRLNDLRHSFASNLVTEGLPLPVIRDALGHTTTRMTERYAKPSPHALELMRDAMNRRQQRVTMDTRMDTRAQKGVQ